jgi:predicted nicotinamide N-methyase
VEDLVEERVIVGMRQLRLLRPRSAETLIDEDAFGEDEFLPYWAELWPSGLALAEHVTGAGVAGKVVLELGCGLAVPSLAAALCGADVLATDWAPEAIALAEQNALGNGVSLRAALLRWDAPGSLGADSFDLVLAADVLYEARNALPLLDLLDRAVAPGGTALLADPGRRHARLFLDAAPPRGWVVTAHPTALLPRGAVYELARRPW